MSVKCSCYPNNSPPPRKNLSDEFYVPECHELKIVSELNMRNVQKACVANKLLAIK